MFLCILLPAGIFWCVSDLAQWLIFFLCRESFKSLSDFRQQILRVKDSGTLFHLTLLWHQFNLFNKDGYPLVICGNKADMEEAREVPKEEGQQMGQMMNCPQFETSARVRLLVLLEWFLANALIVLFFL